MDNFVILDQIGSGATSSVFRVREKHTNDIYAMKKVVYNSPPDEERVLQEVQVLHSLDHPNVVKYHTSFMEQNTCYLVMEECATSLESIIETQKKQQGGSGRNRRAGGKLLSESLLIEWMAELLSAVSYLHRHRILHRDIKSSNIFVTRKNHLKLGDFGVCKVLSTTTVCGRSMVGTPFYLAPEVCSGETYNETCDVWSLGVVFYEMCTLRKPFQGDNFLGIIREICHKDVEPFHTGLDARFENIVKNMLHRDPKLRPSPTLLMDHYFILPSSHPSHPDMTAIRARELQMHHGPRFAAVDNKDAGCPTRQRSKEGPPLLLDASPSKGTRKKAVVVAIPKVDCHNVKRSSRVADNHNNLLASCNGTTAAKQPQRHSNFPLMMDAVEHTEALRRIKSVKATVNVLELRRRMCGQQGAVVSGEVQKNTIVFLPLSLSPPSPQTHTDPINVVISRSPIRIVRGDEYLINGGHTKGDPPPTKTESPTTGIVIEDVTETGNKGNRCGVQGDTSAPSMLVDPLPLNNYSTTTPLREGSCSSVLISSSSLVVVQLLRTSVDSYSLHDFDLIAEELHRLKMMKFGVF